MVRTEVLKYQGRIPDSTTCSEYKEKPKGNLIGVLHKTKKLCERTGETESVFKR